MVGQARSDLRGKNEVGAEKVAARSAVDSNRAENMPVLATAARAVLVAPVVLVAVLSSN